MAGASPTEPITVRCACGTKLKAPASAVGRKAKCPKCAAVLTIQRPAPAEPEPIALGDDDELDSSSPPPQQQQDDDLYGFADDPQPGRRGSVAVPPPPPVPPPMGGPVGAVRPLDASGAIPMGTPAGIGAGGTSPFPPPIRTSVPVQTPAAQPVAGGSFFKGLGLSVALAFVGSLVWFGIAALTGYELGWIALGVGMLAGVGMAAGYGSHNALSGVTAAFVAVLAIVVGKVMVFVFVLIPTYDRMIDADDPEGARDRIVMQLTEDELEAKGIDTEDDDDDASEREWERAERAAQKKVDAMSDAEVEQLDAKIRADWDKESLVEMTMVEALEKQGLEYADTSDEQDAAARKEAEAKIARMTPDQQKAELERLNAAAEAEADAGVDPGVKKTVTIVAYTLLFFHACFGLLDILFMLFALATAFQVATSGAKT